MRTVYGGGLPQGGDLRLLEDGGERGDALDSDAVVPDTASEGAGWNGERVGVSTGADTNATLWGGGALELGDPCLLEDGGERGGALVSDLVAPDTAKGG